MNRAQFKAISHEYRALNLAARVNSADHVCTARNCACKDSYQERHTGWQWHIAQQHGEAMATRIAKMFAWRFRKPAPTISQRLQNRYAYYWTKKSRRAALNVAMARCDELFGKSPIQSALSDLEALDWATKSAPPVRHGAAGVNPSSSNTNAGAWGAVPLYVCSITGDPS